MKIALVDDEQKCLDEIAEICHDFSMQHCCQMETVSFLNGEAFLEAFEYVTKPFSPQRIFQVLTDILEVFPPLQIMKSAFLKIHL